MLSQTTTPAHRSVASPTHEPLRPEDFVGLWQVRRRLVDHLGHETLGFAGQARIGTGAHFVHLGLAPDQRVLHHCGDDLYEGRFIFRSRDFWIEFWRASGPRKRYASLTRYERIRDPA
jgi:hypothetical protein